MDKYKGYTSSAKLKYLLWREEQKKKVDAIKKRARCARARIKWAREASRWGHEHPVRGE